MCWSRIFSPRAMRIMPPAASILFSKKWPKVFPIKTPRQDSRKVTVPIIDTARISESVNSERVIPTAKASMLVAKESTSSM